MKTKSVLFFVVAIAVILASCNGDYDKQGNAKTYTLNVSRNIPAGGNVIVNGVTNPAATTRTPGSTITLRATPNSGYTFVNWTATSGTLPKFTDGSATAATVTFSINSNVSIRANFRVNFQLHELPVLIINTGGRPIDSRDVWMTGVSYELFDEAGALLTQGETEIRGRGHSTWSRDDFPKKPYNLRLGSDKALLGMPSHNRWALLANYSDKTLLRTEVAFYKLASIFDNIPWTPSARQVDLYLNGEYRGVYQLTESVRASDNRVKFNRIRNTNPDGGFLLEICTRLEDEYHFTTARQVWVNCSSPDSNLDVLINGTSMTIFEKIMSYIQEAENVLYSSDFTDQSTGWQKYLEMDSFVDFYLINEVAKNNDAQFYSSVYMYYDDAIGKLRMGPIWDFDISMGNINYNSCDRTDGLYIYHAKWLRQLFRDPLFVAAVKARWIEKYDELSTIYQFIDERAAYLNTAQAANFEKWPTLNQKVWPNRVVTGSYAGEIEELKFWLSQRINWLDEELRTLTAW